MNVEIIEPDFQNAFYLNKKEVKQKRPEKSGLS
jgi:hypothetical protein